MVTGSIPPTGIPLPFISFGGSSLVVFLSAIGILCNVSKTNENSKEFGKNKLEIKFFKKKKKVYN